MKTAPRMRTILLAVILGALILSGCTGSRFSVSFDQIQGLKVEDPVLFKSTPVGQVEKIVYTADGTFLVTLTIADDFAFVATDHSRFYIGRTPDRRAVIIEQAQPGGKKIQKDAVVQGEDRTPRGRFTWLMKQLEARILTLLSDIEEIPETEQYDRLKEKLEALETWLKTSGKAASKTFETEILPRLEEKIHALAERLRRMGESDKARRLEEELDKLQTI